MRSIYSVGIPECQTCNFYFSKVVFSVKGKKPSEIDKKLLAKPMHFHQKSDTNANSDQDNKNTSIRRVDSKKRKIFEISKSLHLSTNLDDIDSGGQETEETNINEDYASNISKIDEEYFIAKLEYFIEFIKIEFLFDVIEATKKYIIKKQTRTVHELEREIREEEEALLVADAKGQDGEGDIQEDPDYRVNEEDMDDSEDDEIYNPKNIPLGPDGKPIPLWQYKLHQLDKEFSCEICGGKIFKGPKKFKEHFNEWEHKAALQTLGIKYTPSLYLVTTIAEAKRILESNKGKVSSNLFNPNQEEEFEDSEGNVYKKNTFEDLKRQGYI